MTDLELGDTPESCRFKEKINPVDNTKNTIVLYHKNCTDGFGAAYAAWCKLQDAAIYVAVQYGDDLRAAMVGASEDCEGEYDFTDLYMVDFSCSPADLINFSDVFDRVTVIDHHESAVRKLQESNCLENCNGEVNLILDMERSGAVMTWQYFFPKLLVPAELQMIQDRDLWQFKFPKTKAFVARLYMIEFDMQIWDSYFQLSRRSEQYHCDPEQTLFGATEQLIVQGEVLLEEQENRVGILEKHAHNMVIEQWSVPCVNANHFFASDLGNNLSMCHPFAVSYTLDNMRSRILFSLRSSKSNKYFVNVAKVAEKFGGGGHCHAAGFEVPMNMESLAWLAGKGRLMSKDFKDV